MRGIGRLRDTGMTRRGAPAATGRRQRLRLLRGTLRRGGGVLHRGRRGGRRLRHRRAGRLDLAARPHRPVGVSDKDVAGLDRAERVSACPRRRLNHGGHDGPGVDAVKLSATARKARRLRGPGPRTALNRGPRPARRPALARPSKAGVVASASTARAGRLPLDAVELAPVIPNPAKIFCVGHNYEEHRQETGRARVGAPVDLHPLRRHPGRRTAIRSAAGGIDASGLRGRAGGDHRQGRARTSPKPTRWTTSPAMPASTTPRCATGNGTRSSSPRARTSRHGRLRPLDGDRRRDWRSDRAGDHHPPERDQCSTHTSTT